ncbi:MAG: DUF3089 domain-containing protein, partial [Candidatus Eremiobacteraeota bacterium]|nr:DUF3089 domain-containing protein [Candidatus Eremiobacteraeota bacterium]
MIALLTATLWLCNPTVARDPCTADLTATRVLTDGARRVVHLQADRHSRFDCFYVYHTVSTAQAPNAPLIITAEERRSAVVQASRFSPVCRMWAAVYRQATLRTMTAVPFDGAAYDAAYADVRAAWDDFIAHHNAGRPFVLIGHSQGSSMLIRLMRERLDMNASLRARMIAAVLLGGNVTDKSFSNIHACSKLGQTGCVIAFSSFTTPPLHNARYGIPGQGVSLQSRQLQRSGVAVICTNPARVTGSIASFDSYFPAYTQRG